MLRATQSWNRDVEGTSGLRSCRWQCGLLCRRVLCRTWLLFSTLHFALYVLKFEDERWTRIVRIGRGRNRNLGGGSRTKLSTKQAYPSASQEQQPSSIPVFQRKKPRLGRMFREGRGGLRGLGLRSFLRWWNSGLIQLSRLNVVRKLFGRSEELRARTVEKS